MKRAADKMYHTVGAVKKEILAGSLHTHKSVCTCVQAHMSGGGCGPCKLGSVGLYEQSWLGRHTALVAVTRIMGLTAWSQDPEALP